MCFNFAASVSQVLVFLLEHDFELEHFDCRRTLNPLVRHSCAFIRPSRVLTLKPCRRLKVLELRRNLKTTHFNTFPAKGPTGVLSNRRVAAMQTWSPVGPPICTYICKAPPNRFTLHIIIKHMKYDKSMLVDLFMTKN